MRRTWATLLHERMKHDKNIIVCCADMGYGILDEIQRDYPDRFFNVGIAEQLATLMAVGFALSGKSVWVYGIITFTLYKSLEQIRNYVIGYNLPIIYALVGKDKTYAQLDISHWALEDKEIAKAIGLCCYEPIDKEDLEKAFKDTDGIFNHVKGPMYIRMA